MQLQKPALIQTQKLKLSPQMLQSIRIMALPLLDLKIRIQRELEENPALELIDNRETLSLDSLSEKTDEEPYFEEFADFSTAYSYDQAASDLKQGFMENVLSRPETLQDHLVWQLRLQPLSAELLELGELLIHNLDMNGFHIEEPSTLLPPEKQELIPQVIPVIQKLDPVGCCSADYLESLKVQASLLEDVSPIVFTIINEHLSDLGKIPALAKKLSIPVEELEHNLWILKSLTPFPGREYAQTNPGYIVPDVVVTSDKGQWKVVVNEDEIPVLGLNNFFSEMKGNRGRTNKEAVDFAKNRVRDARWFINTIQQRHSTLQKVALAIVKHQRDFFLTGPKGIIPLILKDVAEDVGVHETTISRLTRGKYMQTEFGVFELKYFFTNAVEGFRSGGGNYGKVAVKAIIQEILETGNNLSDQKVANLLGQRGIKLARRTVAKYRKELNISSSYDR